MNYAQRRQCLWILFLAGLALTILVVAATATTLAPLSFTELTQKATAVARVRCLSVSSSAGEGEIWTVTQFAVLTREKGTLPEKISIRMLGGRADGIRSHVDGVPEFHPGEEVYLFLWNRDGEPYRVLGWTQGTFRIFRDGRNGVQMVTQDSAVAAIFDAKAKAFRHEGIVRMRVDQFEEKLRSAISRSQ
jgi:hypothetical protein